MRRLVRRLRRNFGYKLLSLTISVMLYLIASAQISPRTSTDIYVQPEVVGVPEDMVVRAAPTGGTVTVSGPSAIVSAFKALPVKAIVDVSRAHIGTHQLPIVYKTPNGIDLMGQPHSADVTLERKARSVLFVDVLNDGMIPPPGYEYTDAVAEPRKVTISGLAGDVAHVARVVALLPKEAGAGAIYQFVDLVAQNEHQQSVDAVQIDPPRVQIKVGLRRAPASKTVLLSARLVGVPAPGYAVTGYTFTPPMVTVSGMQDRLTDRSSLAIPVPIDGVKAPADRTLLIPLPVGLALQNPADASVRIHIDIKPISPIMPSLPSPAVVPSSAPPQTPSSGPSPTASPLPSPSGT